MGNMPRLLMHKLWLGFPTVPQFYDRRLLQLSHLIPGRAVFAVAQPIGLGVINELLACRVPAEHATQLITDVCQMAHLGAAGADLDVGDRLAARTDTVEPVLPMVRGNGGEVEV